MKVDIYDTVKIGEMELPDKCPHCQADLTADDAIIEWDWRDVSFRCTMNKAQGMLNTEDDHDGEEFLPTSFECAACHAIIASPQMINNANNT